MTRHLPRKGMQVRLSAPVVELMMSGVTAITQSHDGLITLWYRDGSSESAHVKDLYLLDEPEYFHVVGAVQGAGA